MKKDEIIYGLHPVQEAILAGKEIDRLLIQKGLKGSAYAGLWQLLKAHNILYQLVPLEKLNQLTRSNHQGLIAFVSQIEYQPIDAILPAVFENGEVPLVVVLDRITDVRNAGAIARTALCAGVHALIIPERGGARMTADAVKTSAGALHTLPVCRVTSLKDTLLYLRQSGLKIVASTEKAAMNYFEADLRPPLAIVMGSEEDGIAVDLMRMADELLRIPMSGPVTSLNVSVSAGILMYEALRQRSLSLNA